MLQPDKYCKVKRINKKDWEFPGEWKKVEDYWKESIPDEYEIVDEIPEIDDIVYILPKGVERKNVSAGPTEWTNSMDNMYGKIYEVKDTAGNTIYINDDIYTWAIKPDKYVHVRLKSTSQEEWGEPEEVEAEEAETPPELRDVDIKTECKMMRPMPVLLEGPVGTGKTTILLELAEELGLDYYASVLTDQTSASEFKGYKNAMNGEYVMTEFRKAIEHGGMFVLEELNAATSNLPIIFNTIENGYFVFADKLVKVHPDFWLCATMNTITNNKDFGGRRVLDKSVKD
jgi:SpoVK/Ycf46/Vps4 family AAA+-type ATPase